MKELPKKPNPRAFSGDSLDLPFWEGAEQGKLLVHCCDICGRSYWPASACVEHGAQAMKWVEASGRGVVHTYTIIHRPWLAAWADDVPYNVAVVELDEGPLMFTNIVDCPNDKIRCRMKVEVVFTPVEGGGTLPRFRPALSTDR